LMAVIFIYTKNILYTILFHLFHNAIAVFDYKFNYYNIDLVHYICLPVCIISMTVMFLMIRRIYKKNKLEAEKLESAELKPVEILLNT
jgi:membrane protease YdiL (CAAX protease family)